MAGCTPASAKFLRISDGVPVILIKRTFAEDIVLWASDPHRWI
jgi:hypothetical protein